MNVTEFIQGSFLISGGIFSFIWGIHLILANPKVRTMSWILWISSLWLFSGAYIFTGLFIKFPYFYLLHLPFVYATGPLFLLFYKKIILEENPKKLFLHLFLAFSL